MPQKSHLKQILENYPKQLRFPTSNCEPAFFMLAFQSWGVRQKHAVGFHDVNIVIVTESQVFCGGPWLANKRPVQIHVKQKNTNPSPPVKSTKTEIACLAAFFCWACSLACPRTIVFFAWRTGHHPGKSLPSVRL